jgi:hypothetical protein
VKFIDGRVIILRPEVRGTFLEFPFVAPLILNLFENAIQSFLKKQLRELSLSALVDAID